MSRAKAAPKVLSVFQDGDHFYVEIGVTETDKVKIRCVATDPVVICEEHGQQKTIRPQHFDVMCCLCWKAVLEDYKPLSHQRKHSC
jgi:hypothetical protein